VGAPVTTSEDDLHELERKMKQLKLDYDQYFLGTRPRAPVLLRNDVQRTIAIYSNTPIQNTALRFRFNSMCSRFQAQKRQWDETLRKIESGTYERHRFKADLHDRQRGSSQAQKPERKARDAAASPGSELFDDYRKARESCGQGVEGLSPEKLDRVIDQQRAQLRERFGDAEFRFRVVVEGGKAKLKASRKKKPA
jgi:hypothetical protein